MQAIQNIIGRLACFLELIEDTTVAAALAWSRLGGRTLTSGVYSTDGGFTLVGTAPLTLDGQGSAGAVFILQAATTLITAAATQVQLTGDAQACNVFWELGTSATLGGFDARRHHPSRHLDLDRE